MVDTLIPTDGPM